MTGELAAAEARERIGRGIELASAARQAEALQAFDEVVAEFGRRPQPEVQFEVARAILVRASLLRDLERMDEALAGFDDVLGRTAASGRRELDVWTACALYEKSHVLERTGRSRQALAGYDEVARRFGDDPRPELAEWVARAMVDRAVVLGYLQGAGESAAAYGEPLQRFEGSGDPSVREVLEVARRNRAELLDHGDRELVIQSAEQELAASLVDAGSELGNAGRPEEAMARFDAVLRRFGEADYAPLQLLVAQAGYNKGVALRVSGRPLEAVGAFDEVLRRFAGAGDPGLLEQCAITHFNKGIALADAGRAAEAVDTFGEVVRDYADQELSAVRERVARALVVQADLLWELGRLAEAVAARAEVLRRFAGAAEPVLRECVAAVRGQQEQLLSTAPPARAAGGYAATFAQADSGLDLALDLLEDSDVRITNVYSVVDPTSKHKRRLSRREKRQLAEAVEQASQRLEQRDARLHEQAEAVLSEYRSRGHPFALFLRNFDLEAHAGSSREGRTVVVERDEEEVERKLAAALRGRLPLVGIANPALVRPDYRHSVPKLLVADEHWREVLASLLLAAELVVMHLERITPGVAEELTAILEFQRQDAAVILVPPRAAQEQPDALGDWLMAFEGIDRRAGEAPAPELLRRFPRVVPADEVPFERLDASPAFADLLARVDRLTRPHASQQAAT